MATVEELFDQFKKLPDWDRYPLPEAYYTHFKIKKPQPASIGEICCGYNPPPYQSLNENGKVEIRGPAPGGLREIKDLMTLPVEVKVLTDETSSDKQLDSAPNSESHPIADNTIKIQPLSDLGSEGLSDAFPYISHALPYPQSKDSRPSQPPQNALSSHDPNQTERPLSISSQACLT